ncbi:GGDEF domain-containing protein [Aestuariispira insulae]|uniref:diguanylate cyclase n=1 Tax=Aestuariispira insulae TaxID=1461337 RepID=A0A3D9HEU5_9PROT|nr:GGDEF domain-containing protein [Aestuariispira insulae]RED47998.1 diguanylate cyclase (GGDEF)-like protein [Aestuariispira insulae]
MLSVTDPLTGSYNRMHFIETAEQFLEDCRARDCRLSLALIDVDRFGALNDEYGEAAGDQALVAVVDACNAILHDAFSDLKEKGIGVSRLGGEEFAFMLPTMDSAIAVSFLESIRACVADREINHQDNRFRVTISIGVAVLGAGDSLDDLLAHADCALYQAKEEGRNKVVLYRPGLATPPVGRRVTRSEGR